MAKNKTVETTESVDAFLNQFTDEIKRNDGHRLIVIMQEESGYDAKMWGDAIIGFGTYHYKYESGREGDAPLVAFSPRAHSFSLYISLSPGDKQVLLQTFGKYKISGGCIHIKKLADIDGGVLRKMINLSVKQKDDKRIC
jgi:hypothetical protein